MNSKKITLIIIAIILIATAAVFSLKFAQKTAQAPTVTQAPPVKTPSQVAKKGTDSTAQSSQENAIQADPDAKTLEADINSVSDEDFSDNSLSDQNVGL